jgi:glutamate/tyrosine decarboxylase-like PLP-dependent enzyme
VVDRELLHQTAEYAADFLEELDSRPVRPRGTPDALRGPLPQEGMDPRAVIAALVEAAEPGLVASAGPRYYGFVTGGALPAALAADWLASAWDQNGAMHVMSPAAATAEEVCGGWLAELLGLPPHVSVAFTTGCQMANVTALAAARERLGLSATVIVGERRHVTIDRALRLLGFDLNSVVVVPADDQGRMRVDALPPITGPAIVCGQAGEVNTGAFDDFDAIADRVAGTGAWFHVDGAFGLWAAASPSLRRLTRGVDRADSWATDAHKWLNVPYDSGLAFCAHPDAHHAALSATAAYLPANAEHRDAIDWTPDASRRARGFAIYAAIRQLGAQGIADLVDRCCAHALLFADLLRAGGLEVLNDVVLNQVLVRVGPEVVASVQEDGTCWLGGTTWDGGHAMRISVSNWRTSEDDVRRSADAILAAARVQSAA